jgi:hypothetical protein
MVPATPARHASSRFVAREGEKGIDVRRLCDPFGHWRRLNGRKRLSALENLKTINRILVNIGKGVEFYYAEGSIFYTLTFIFANHFRAAIGYLRVALPRINEFHGANLRDVTDAAALLGFVCLIGRHSEFAASKSHCRRAIPALGHPPGLLSQAIVWVVLDGRLLFHAHLFYSAFHTAAQESSLSRVRL